jgi:hypothetical protein
MERRGYRDGELLVRVSDDPARAPSKGWLLLPTAAPVTLWAQPDGQELEVYPADLPVEALAAAVRAAVPFAAALQGKVTLHAAGVSTRRGIAAIVGASGAGKSTLARALAATSMTVVADDLLPCRLLADRVAAPSPERARGATPLTPLTGIFFLDRQAKQRQPALVDLGARQCFERLVHHGFGELANARAWGHQVEIYHRIARDLPAFQMTIPDDLERVAEVAGWFEAVCRRVLE